MEIINLNIVPKGSNPVCHASQFDEGRTIRCKLHEDGTVYSVRSGDLFSLNVRKPDNTIVTIDLTATEGNDYVDFTTTEQMCAVAGDNVCDLRISNSGIDIGTANFIMRVEKDATDGGVPSESDISNLKTQVEGILTTEEYSQLTTVNKTIIGAINEIDAGGGGGGAYWTDVTGTLTAGSTTITLSNVAILPTSTIDIYVNNVFYGVNPTSISVSAGSVTLTFDAQSNDMPVKVRIS